MRYAAQTLPLRDLVPAWGGGSVVGGGARGTAVSGCFMECYGEGLCSILMAYILTVASVFLVGGWVYGSTAVSGVTSILVANILAVFSVLLEARIVLIIVFAWIVLWWSLMATESFLWSTTAADWWYMGQSQQSILF